MKNKMFLILGILVILLTIPLHAAAKAPEVDVQPEKYAAIEINGNNAKVPFLDLGYRERTLNSPYGITNIYFNTPLSWKLIPGGEIEINYDVFLSGADLGKVVDSANPYGGNLIFTFNGQIIGSTPLEGMGSHTVRLEIPDTALTSILQDGRHQLTISLEAQFSCDYDVNARIVVNPTSFFDLFFEESSPELNLSRLPSPFYLENSFIPDSTLVVVADNPDALEPQSALNVMAGFGSMIGRVYDMQLITVSQLAGFDPTLYHMIFVGTADKFPVLTDVNFKIPITDGKFVNLSPASETDGIVELALSPWNPTKVIMAVSGNSGDAVMKAGQAVSSGRVFVYSDPTVAFVSNVQALSDTLPIVEDFTFESLGYVTETLSGIGLKSKEYIFYVSKEQVLTKDAYVDLVYYHSGLLDYGVSSFSVELNGQVISSTPFSKESEQVTTLRIKFPPGTLRFGENRLDIRASMIILPSCDTSGFSDPWFTVSNQSSIHLPVTLPGINAEPLLKDLKFFPELFVTHSDLGDIAFIFPKSDVASWVIAGKLAYNLGQQFNPLIANLEAAFSDEVPQQVHDDNSMIILGLASETPFLSEFNDMLPAPFDMASNLASEKQMQVVYRIPEGVSVGYLELLLSPYNAEKSILVISGNDRNGVLLAGDSLLVNELESQLAGVFAVTNGKQVATGNASSPFSIVDNVVPGAEAVSTTPVPEILAGGPPLFERPVWLIPAIVLSSITVVGVLGYVAISAIAKRRQEKRKLLAGEEQTNQEEDKK